MNVIPLNYLQQYFDEIEPMGFYRSIFPVDELEKKGQQITGKYNGVAVELMPKESKIPIKRHLIHDDLNAIKELLKSDNFVIVSPISYAGKTRGSKNARFIYAMAIDLDGISSTSNMRELFYQFTKINKLPNPTFTVWSGNGLHLYYKFKKAIPCYAHIVKQLATLKRQLTYLMWNEYTTDLSDNIQYESLFQGFRLVGGVIKDGQSRTRVFETGEPIDIEYLNSFVAPEFRLTNYEYKRDLSLAEAQQKYPEWYENRIIKGMPKGSWTCKRELFLWWLDKLPLAKIGHRYYFVMCLAVYAKKSGISRSELEDYAFNLVDRLDALTDDENNHFTRADVVSALEAYNDDYIRFPIDIISKLTDIPIHKNRRNFRKQETHLKIARFTKQMLIDEGKDVKGGRPSKQKIVEDWQRENLHGTIMECHQQTGLSRTTIYKYWV